MGGLTLPHNRVSYQRRRTSVFWWIPWHLHWCHPSKASQIRIRLPKNKKMEHLESIIQCHTVNFLKQNKYTQVFWSFHNFGWILVLQTIKFINQQGQFSDLKLYRRWNKNLGKIGSHSVWPNFQVFIPIKIK